MMLMARILSICSVLALLLPCGCSSPHQGADIRNAAALTPPATAPSGFPRTITDASGSRLTLKSPPRRIVSLAPSTTEILYKLGLADRLVMDTTSCDYPPEAKNKPHIDAINGSLEAIQVQNPDLVIGLNHINDRLIGAAKKAGLPTLVIDDANLAQTYEAIQLIGRATGTDAAADQIVKNLQARIEALRKAVAVTPDRPRVLAMYGTSPIYTTGPESFISDIIAIAGGVNVVDKPLPGNVISSAQVMVRRPDVIVCSADIARQARLLPGWATGVPAVRNNRFYSAEETLERPGPRLAEAAERLAYYLHPNLKQKARGGAKQGTGNRKSIENRKSKIENRNGVGRP